METLTFRSRIEVPAAALFAWHARPGAFQRLAPPWAPVTLEHFEGIHDGQRAVIRLGFGPLSLRWVAEHHGYVEGQQFRDTQVAGPFRHWTHIHRMEPAGADASYLIDHIEYEVPTGGLGEALSGTQVRRQLQRQFSYRHRVTRQDLALHRHYAPAAPLKVAVSGDSGLIGSSLVPLLTTGGHAVHRMVRTRPVGPEDIYWNHETGEVEAEKLEGLDAVIHLAGENVLALRWTEEKKRRIYTSRVAGTRLLSETLARLDRPPRVLLSASAIGYYGSRGSETLTEASPAGTGFLSTVVQHWEGAVRPAADAGIRTATLRIGVVLSAAGGALGLARVPFQLGLGGYAGEPDQYLSWIGLDDVLYSIYHALLTEAVRGPVNLVAPQPVSIAAFAHTLGGVLGRPAALRVPAGAVRLLFGELAEEALLASMRVLPAGLQQTGYDFRYPDLVSALRHQLGRA